MIAILLTVARLCFWACSGLQKSIKPAKPMDSKPMDSKPMDSKPMDWMRVGLPWPDLTNPAPLIGGGEKDAAVIVAIEQYEHVPSIPGAKSNADAWYKYFIKTLKVPVQKVKLMPQKYATKEEILRALEDAATFAQPGGHVWFVFIGHGAPWSGDGLLLEVDVRQSTKSIEDRGLRYSEVVETLSSSHARHLSTKLCLVKVKKLIFFRGILYFLRELVA
jgi:hypothetical protein